MGTFGKRGSGENPPKRIMNVNEDVGEPILEEELELTPEMREQPQTNVDDPWSLIREEQQSTENTPIVEQNPGELGQEKTKKEVASELESSVKALDNIQRIKMEESREGLAEKAGVLEERKEMERAQAYYLNAYKEYLANKKFYQKKEPESLKELEAAYNTARVNYANVLEASLMQRLRERGVTDGEKAVVLIEKYNALVRFNEVIKPAIEGKLQARQDVLDARGKNIFAKMGGWVAQSNRKLDEQYGRNKARVIRAAAAASLVSVGAAMGGAALGAVAVYGSQRFLRAIIGTFVGSGAGEAVGTVYQKLFADRSQQNAAKYLGSRDARHVVADGFTEEDLVRIDREREVKLKYASGNVQAKRKALIKAFTAFGAGAGTAAALADWFPIEPDEPSQASNTAQQDSAPARPEPRVQAPIEPQESNPSPTAQAPVETQQRVTPEVENVQPSPEAPRTALIEARVSGGQGTDSLFRELEATVRSTLTPQQMDSASPVMKHFLESHENAISREMGAAYGENGLVTHPNDRFYFDANQNLYYDPANGEPQLFLENDPEAEGGIRRHELQVSEIRTAPTPVEVVSDSVVENAPAITQDAVTETASQVVLPRSEVAETPATQIEPQNQAPETVPEVQSPSGIHTLGDFLQNSNQQPDSHIHTTPESSAPMQVEPSAPSEGATPLGEWLERNNGASTEPLAWTPEQGLPNTPSVFAVREASNIFYANAPTPEQSMQLAREYGMQHPDAKVYFDNTKHDWLGGSTPQIGSLEFDRYGNLKEFTERVLDQRGEARTSISPEMLRERIV